LRNLLTRLLRRLEWRHGVHLVRILGRTISGSSDVPAPTGLTVRVVREDEMLAHCADEALGLTPSWVRDAFARGDACAAAFDGEVLAGYVWSTFEAAPDVDGIWVRVGGDSAYRYKAFVRPDYRGRGIAPALYHHLDAAAIRHGRRTSIGFIALHNTASLAAAQTSGSRCLGHVAYCRLGGRLIAFHSPAATRAGLRFFLPSKPTLASTEAATR
jgi:GNAT superfamily N-acetyltransferase